MIRFEIGGRPVDPKNMADALMAAMLENFRQQIQERVGSIRDPETGEFPTVVVRGSDFDNLSLQVEGSEELIALVKERLGLGIEEEEAEEVSAVPKVFLSYTSDDIDLAERIANALMDNGIDTWWDQWCIEPGDSLRQKIDQGLSECTHFLVLLTPRSIVKPWVNQEMDGALVRKLSDQCRFLPLRYELPASELPPLLSGMKSPEIGADDDIAQLVSDIHGVSRKPKLGTPPETVVEARKLEAGYSPAAMAIAKYFVESSRIGIWGDPFFDDVEPLSEAVGMSVEDTEDGLMELSAFFRDTSYRVINESSLFTQFDKFWKDWDPHEDGTRVAADLFNDPDFPHSTKQIAERYGWEPRRLNPAVTYLLERSLIRKDETIGSHPFVMNRLMVLDGNLRRFLKGRS